MRRTSFSMSQTKCGLVSLRNSATQVAHRVDNTGSRLDDFFPTLRDRLRCVPSVDHELTVRNDPAVVIGRMISRDEHAVLLSERRGSERNTFHWTQVGPV